MREFFFSIKKVAERKLTMLDNATDQKDFCLPQETVWSEIEPDSTVSESTISGVFFYLEG